MGSDLQLRAVRTESVSRQRSRRVGDRGFEQHACRRHRCDALYGGTGADAHLHRAQSLYAPAGERKTPAGTEGDLKARLDDAYGSARVPDLRAGSLSLRDRL